MSEFYAAAYLVGLVMAVWSFICIVQIAGEAKRIRGLLEELCDGPAPEKPPLWVKALAKPDGLASGAAAEH